MKLAVFADTHLGYPRFEADSYIQAQRVIDDACRKADILLCAGDIFDTKIPKLETLKKAVDIFSSASKPVYAIWGNHERRTKDAVNPVQLLAASTAIRLLHGASEIFMKDSEKAQIVGIGAVPEDMAEEAIGKVMGRIDIEPDAFKVLMIHQTIRELVPVHGDELSLAYLEKLPFDLMINGHIHERHLKLDGRFLIPGGTVITQLKKDQAEPRGYYLYDTMERKAEFVEIESRHLSYESMEFSGEEVLDARSRIVDRITAIRREKPDSIIVLKLEGRLKEGADSAQAKPSGFQDVFIENRLDEKGLSVKLERIKSLREENLSVRDLAIKELEDKTKEKVTLFEPSELFDKLLQGPEEALEYLENRNKKEVEHKEDEKPSG